MRQYIIKRLLISVVIIFFVAIMVYGIMRALPNSYLENIARARAMQPGSTRTYQEWLAQLGTIYGLGDNPVTGFFTWFGNAIRLDFGDSWFYGVPVVEKFNSVILDSIWLIGVATIFEYLIAIPLGMLAATRQYKKTDYVITVVAMLGISLPSFFLATILKLVLSHKLGWFDFYGKVGRDFLSLSAFGQLLDIAKHYVMPILTIVIINMGSLVRYTRTNMLEVLNADFIRTARAKGLPERRVITRHAYRNTLIPIVTFLGGVLPSLFSGAIITEILYQIPGSGNTAFVAIVQGDMPFAMYFLMFVSVMTIIGTFISDMLYAVADPRIRIA